MDTKLVREAVFSLPSARRTRFDPIYATPETDQDEDQQSAEDPVDQVFAQF